MVDWTWIAKYYWVTFGELENERFHEKNELWTNKISGEENAEIFLGIFSNSKWIV